METVFVGIYVLMLAAFVGLDVISKVPLTLQTPILTGVNALSGVIVIGALYATRGAESTTANMLGATALFLATAHVVGGFVVTDRLLKPVGKKK